MRIDTQVAYKNFLVTYGRTLINQPDILVHQVISQKVMKYLLPEIQKVDVTAKRVFLLADLDVPLSDGASANTKIEDDTRLVAAMTTLQYVLDHGAVVTLAGKLGRPGGVCKKELSLAPVAKWFAEKLHIANNQYQISKRGAFDGWEMSDKVFLLENLRFNPGEEANDPAFAKQLASLADIYINDAFALCHRAHASVAGIPSFLPHYAGLHLEKEVEVLSKVMDNPERPLVVVIGGKKIETKLPLVTKMAQLADYVLVGGKVGQELQSTVQGKAKLVVATGNANGTDVTAESLAAFITIVKLAKTIIWNGPVGLVPNQGTEDSEKGTRELAQAITESSAYAVVGGGDTVEYLKQINLIDKFGFVSTGGGAMLSFLSGEQLPGLEALVK